MAAKPKQKRNYTPEQRERMRQQALRLTEERKLKKAQQVNANGEAASRPPVQKGESVRQADCGQAGPEAQTHARRTRGGQSELGPDGLAVFEVIKDGLGQCGGSENVHDASGPREHDKSSAPGDENSHAERGAGASASASSDRPVSSSNPNPNAAGEPVHSDSVGDPIPFAEQLKRLRDPIYFARANCLNKLDPWQFKLLDDARTPGRSALRGANGIGKTVIICVLILFFLSTIKNCRVVIVSGVFRQLKMMVDHLQSLLKNFPGWRVLRGSHELHTPFAENKAIWFSTDSPGAAQGQHSVVEGVSYEDEDASAIGVEGLDGIIAEAKQTKSCLILIRDESRDIPEGVKAATDTFGADWTFDFSCPGNSAGWFYEIFTLLGDLYRTHHVTAYDSSYVSRLQIDEMARIHGPTSARFKNSVMAEFSDVDVRNLISLEKVNRCFAEPQPWRHPGFIVAGIDLSAAKKGGDKCVCVAKVGNKLLEPYFVPPCSGEMEVVALVVRWLRQNKVRFAFIDDGGMGGPMADRMQELLADDPTITLHRINFGAKALDESKSFKNRGTEIWSVVSDKLELRDIIFDWTMEAKKEFLVQATTRKVIISSDGFGLETKEKMRADGRKSPDLVDAVALAHIMPMNENRSALGLNGKVDWDKFKSGNVDQEDRRDKPMFNRTASGVFLGR